MPGLLVCRACLACNVPVYDILNTQYQNVFERIAVLSLADHSKPHSLCAPCLETLQKLCRLLEKSRISEGILTRLLQQNKLSEITINAINRHHYNVADILPIFNLELMKPSEERTTKKDGKHKQASKFEEYLSPSLSHLTWKDKDADKRISSFDSGTAEVYKRQQIGDPTDNVMVKIESGQIESPEDPRDVVVKTEPGETPSAADPKADADVLIDGLTHSSHLTHNIAVKTEPIEMYDCFADVAEPEKGFFKEYLNQSNRTIYIETVKLKETPYIQIDAEKLPRNIKSEFDNDNHETPNIPGSVDNDSLVEIDVEMNQPINTELGEITDDKSKLKEQLQALKSSKGVKEEFIENCKVDGRRIKTVPSTRCKAKTHDKPKTLKEQEPTAQSYHCNKCEYQTPYKKRLMYHTKKHTGFVICAICDYKCATKSRLVSHLRVHTKERPYKCKICNKGFTELGSLRKHKNMHAGVKPYKCMWCDYKATSKNHVDRHIKRHIGDKRFKCELCEYACVQKWDLQRHAKTHENERVRFSKRVAPVNPVIVETVSMAEK